jgi:hypothetical protein
MFRPTPGRARRPLPALALVAPAFALPETAHGSPQGPTVTAEVGSEGVVIRGGERIGQGPVRLDLRGRLAQPRTVAVIELKPGVTADDVRAADIASLDDRGDIARLGRRVAAAVRAGVLADLQRGLVAASVVH